MLLSFAASVIYAVQYLGQLINLLILVRVVFTWINPKPSNPIVAFVYNVTDPILEPIRNLIYNKLGYRGMFDFSALAAIFLINYAIVPIIVRLLVMFLF